MRMSSVVTPSLRVADDDRDVGALGRVLGAQLRVVVDRARDLGAPAQAGGVDQHRLAARRTRRACRSRRASCPPRRSRSRAPRRAAVHERRLADVRPADHREPRGSSSARRHAARGSRSTIRSSRSPVPRPWVAETGIGSPSPSAVELGRHGLLARVVDLVRRHDHRHVGRRAARGQLRVAGPQARRARRPRARPASASVEREARLAAGSARASSSLVRRGRRRRCRRA